MAVLQGIQGAGGVQEKTFGGSSFAPLPADGYVCKILNVKVDKTQTGKQYIKLRFDVAEGEYAGFFQKRWNADAQSQYGQKWKGIFKIFLPIFNGDNEKYMDSIGFYKGQINTIARSNGLQEPDIERGYDPDIFKGCTVGVLFRDADYKGKSFTEPAFLMDVQKIRTGDFEVPAPRKSNSSGTGFSNVSPVNNGSVFSAAASQQPQNAFQQPVQQPFSQPAPAYANAQNTAPQQPMLGDLSDFEEIIGDDKVPF